MPGDRAVVRPGETCYNVDETEVMDMVKKKRPTSAAQPATSDKPATLKDLLNPDIVNKLKAQADDMKAEAAKREEAAKQKAAEAARPKRSVSRTTLIIC